MDHSTMPARTVSALTGLSLTKLKKLTSAFAAAWDLYREKSGLGQNKKHPGRPLGHPLKRILSFALAHLKTNATFDALAGCFNLPRSTFYSLVRRGLSVLSFALEQNGCAPTRDFNSTLQILIAFKNKRKAFIDATERRIRRPTKGQKAFYSGKKKCHTVKNQIICSQDKRIICVSATVEGRIHDLRIFEEQKLSQIYPSTLKTYLDLGYLGIGKTCQNMVFLMPKKKPKGRELSPTQKNKNSDISSKRVLIEHAIGGIKRMQSVSGTCRSINSALRDLKFYVSAGLWNFHLES